MPEAQVDRFMLKVIITYPNKEEEHKIIKEMGVTDKQIKVSAVVGPEDIKRARKVVDEIYMDEKLEKYILDIVFATREPAKYKLNDLAGLIQYGASPRASIYLALASKAYAFIQGRGYVTPQDVKSIGPDILRHRVIVSYEAEAEEKTSEDIRRPLRQPHRRRGGWRHPGHHPPAPLHLHGEVDEAQEPRQGRYDLSRQRPLYLHCGRSTAPPEGHPGVPEDVRRHGEGTARAYPISCQCQSVHPGLFSVHARRHGASCGRLHPVLPDERRGGS